MMNMSARGAAMLSGWEGIVPAPYLCSANTPTVGIGHTASAGPPDPARLVKTFPSRDKLDLSIQSCIELFVRVDLPRYVDAIHGLFESRARALPHVLMHTSTTEQALFDALVHFHFNTGKGPQSVAGKAYAEGDQPVVVSRLLLNWRKNPEVVERRNAEARLASVGVYTARPTAVWETNGNMKLTKVIRRIPYEDMVATFKTFGLK